MHIITGAITALQNIQMRQPLRPAHGTNHVATLGQRAARPSRKTKKTWVCVIDIGGGTTDIAVHTNGAIRHTAVIPVAGDLITKDLAQALRPRTTPPNTSKSTTA